VSTQEIWTYMQLKEQEPAEASLEVLGEAKRLAEARNGTECCALFVGFQLAEAISVVTSYELGRIYSCDRPDLGIYCPERAARIVAQAISVYSPLAVLFPGTCEGNDLACRVSFRLERRLLRNCVNFDFTADGLLRAIRPVYHGRLYSVEEYQSTPFLATFVPGTLGIALQNKIVGRLPLRIDLDFTNAGQECETGSISYVKGDPRTADLEDAEVIVAGGRGLGKREGLQLLQQLADELRGIVGVSRPLVDEKWVPFERQVGQTGKTVHPKLYFACGISGAIQHLMGMRDSGIIIAVNKDSKAPIFEIATLAAEGDLYEIVPPLITMIRERRRIDARRLG
jgi:electron transfer flavoprotein alpha subunit